MDTNKDMSDNLVRLTVRLPVYMKKFIENSLHYQKGGFSRWIQDLIKDKMNEKAIEDVEKQLTDLPVVIPKEDSLDTIRRIRAEQSGKSDG